MEKEIILDNQVIKEYIDYTLRSFIKSKKFIKDDVYHHNTYYESVVSIIYNGLLSPQELNYLGITNYSKENLTLFSNSFAHINGDRTISLSKVGLNNLYQSEDEYNPLSNSLVDIIIDNTIQARRYGVNYGNEFISDYGITPEKFLSIDIRLLNFLKDTDNINLLIKKFNLLKDMAMALKKNNLNIPIREMSLNNDVIEKEELIQMPTLVLRK